MGFDKIAELGLGVAGTIASTDAAGNAAKAEDDARKKAATDAANLVAEKAAETKRQMALGTALTQLRAYAAPNLGSSGTMFSDKLGRTGVSA